MNPSSSFSSFSSAVAAVAEATTTTTSASSPANVGTTATVESGTTTTLPNGSSSAAALSFSDDSIPHPPATSSSTTTATAAPIAVDPNRKRRLLLEARKDRLAWIDASSVPYRTDVDVDPSEVSEASTKQGGAGAEEEEGDVLSMLKSSRACAEVESAMDVLLSLYGGFFDGGGGGGAKGRDRGDFGAAASAAGDVKERIRRQLRDRVASTSRDDVSRAVLNPADRRSVLLAREEEAGRSSSGVRHLVDPLLIEPYEHLLTDLKSVERAVLVQGMRNFVRSFEELASSLRESASKRTMEEESELAQEEDLRKLSSALRTYLDGTRDAMRTGKGVSAEDGRTNRDEDDEEATGGDSDEGGGGGEDPFRDYARRALEAFVYSKVFASIWSVLLASESSKADDADVQERASSLQFVAPRHLEIQCLANVIEQGEDPDSAERTIDRILREPIESLKSMDAQYSPGEKLRCVLEAYRGVNASLASAMNGKKGGDSSEPSASSSGGKGGEGGGALPGADDVLPALILVVLRSKPSRIVSNLKFVDVFATPDQLRGEAGYAYTNLYGAVQFVRDLDLGDANGIGSAAGENETEEAGGGAGTSSLKIDPEEFRRGLERCRERARRKALEESNKGKGGRRDAASSGDGGRPTAEDGWGGGSTATEGRRREELPPDVEAPAPTPGEIRAARLRGEDVNLDWALRWQKERRGMSESTSAAGEVTGQTREAWNDAQRSVYETDDPPLPPGFVRSYSFLSTKPDDVRLSDLPLLLSEYRSLVRATENLLAERSAVQLREKKKAERERRDKLTNDALAADEALLLRG